MDGRLARVVCSNDRVLNDRGDAVLSSMQVSNLMLGGTVMAGLVAKQGRAHNWWGLGNRACDRLFFVLFFFFFVAVRARGREVLVAGL